MSWGNPTGCITNFDPNVDYFPDKWVVQHEEDFSVKYRGYYKEVYNVRSNETFILYQCGAKVPDVPAGTKVFPIPLRTIADQETVTLTFLELLGLRGNIKYMDTTYVISPCAQKLTDLGKVVPLEPTYGNATIRQIQIDSVDAVFGGSDASSEQKVISQSASQDPGTLHRAEWIGFVSLFFNLEKTASQLYVGTENRYYCHSKQARSLGISKSVIWVSYSAPSVYNGNVSSWSISTTPYKQQYVEDAGGIFVNSSQTIFYDYNQLHVLLKNVDIVIDETYYATVDTIDKFYSDFNLKPQLDFPFLKNGQVWRNDRLQNKNGGLAWYENALPEADLVLEEMIAIIHPELHGGSYPFTWFRNLAQGQTIEVSTSASCADPEAVLVARVDDCPASNEARASGSAVLATLLFLVASISC